MAFENQHGVIHVLAVGAIEKAELLLAVRGIVGGIEVEQDLAALAHLIAAETDELLAPSVAQTHQIASRRRVLQRLRRSVVVEHFVPSDGCAQRECWVRKPSVHHSF